MSVLRSKNRRINFLSVFEILGIKGFWLSIAPPRGSKPYSPKNAPGDSIKKKTAYYRPTEGQCSTTGSLIYSENHIKHEL
jgi:hypothetical protein